MSDRPEQPLTPAAFSPQPEVAAETQQTTPRPPWLIPGIVGLIVVAIAVFVILPRLVGDPRVDAYNPTTPPNGTGSPTALSTGNDVAEAPSSDRSPFAEAQRQQLRKAAQDALQRVLELQEILRDLGIETWAPDAYQAAVDAALAGDEAYRSGDFTAAATAYLDAGDALVTLEDSRVAKVGPNPDHPGSKGAFCVKGIRALPELTYSPNRIASPMRRSGPRGSGQWDAISWDEALDIATGWLEPLRADPEKLAFFTGRDQSQSFTSFWAQNFGTPNYAAHGGFCSVNMAAAGIYTMGGAFWEFGQPDWDRTKLFMLFGVAEDHDSNPIKIGLGKLKARGAKVIGVNPIRTGYNAIADDWVGITPGTDGLFILSLVHTLLKAGRIDLDYLARFTNAPVLVNCDPKSPDHGLFLRDDAGKPVVMDRAAGKLAAFDQPGVRPDLNATHRHAGVTHVTVFHKLAERYLSDEYAPENVADRCGVEAARIRMIAAEPARVAFDEAFELDQEWTDLFNEIDNLQHRMVQQKSKKIY